MRGAPPLRGALDLGSAIPLRGSARRWLALVLGASLSWVGGPLCAQRMYGSRGPKSIGSFSVSPDCYQATLDHFQREESQPWAPVEVPWVIDDRAAMNARVTGERACSPVVTTVLCLQLRPSFGFETLIKLRAWRDGHADVEVVVPRHMSFWQQMSALGILSGTRGPQDLATRLLWASKRWTDHDLPAIKGWIGAYRRLRGTLAGPVPTTLATDGIAYRLVARGTQGVEPEWTSSWTAYNPEEGNPVIRWINQVHQGVRKLVDGDRAFLEARARLDDAGPGWAGHLELRLAMKRKDLPSVRALLAKGIDPNGPPGFPQVFPLPTSPEVLEAVLKAGGRVDLKEAPSQETVLHVLLATASTEAAPEAPALPLLDRLLQAGADPDAHDFDGRTPLMLAADRAWPGAIRRLLDKGAKADAREVTGRTALHELCGSLIEGERPGEVESAALLVERGCPIDARDEKGRTPLAMALRGDRLALWTWLLAHGASSDLRDEDGGALLHDLVKRRYATSYGRSPSGRARLALFEQALDALLARGLSLEARDDHGLTPLMITRQEGNGPLALALLRRGAVAQPKTDQGPSSRKRRRGTP